MKKTIALLLTLVLCLSLCACGDSADAPNITGDNSNTDLSLIIYDKKGTPYLNAPKIAEFVETIELTTDNWMEYIKAYCYSYEEEIIEKDAFGEIVSAETITHTNYQLGAGNERYHCFEDAVIELKDKATGELITYVFDYAGHLITKDFNLDNYECTRIKGCLHFINFPEGILSASESITIAGKDAGGVFTAGHSLMLERGTNAVMGYSRSAVWHTW